MSRPTKLRLVPVSGKYCQVAAGGKTFQIWRKYPNSKQDVLGTAVDYEDALALLCLQPSVVAIVPEVKEGKFVSPLEDSDLELIKESQLTGQSKVFNTFSARETTVSLHETTSDHSSKEISALQKSLKEQKEQNDAFQKQLKELTSQLAALTKASKTKE